MPARPEDTKTAAAEAQQARALLRLLLSKGAAPSYVALHRRIFIPLPRICKFLGVRFVPCRGFDLLLIISSGSASARAAALGAGSMEASALLAAQDCSFTPDCERSMLAPPHPIKVTPPGFHVQPKIPPTLFRHASQHGNRHAAASGGLKTPSSNSIETQGANSARSQPRAAEASRPAGSRPLFVFETFVLKVSGLRKIVRHRCSITVMQSCNFETSIDSSNSRLKCLGC